MTFQLRCRLVSMIGIFLASLATAGQEHQSRLDCALGTGELAEGNFAHPIQQAAALATQVRDEGRARLKQALAAGKMDDYLVAQEMVTESHDLNNFLWIFEENPGIEYDFKDYWHDNQEDMRERAQRSAPQIKKNFKELASAPHKPGTLRYSFIDEGNHRYRFVAILTEDLKIDGLQWIHASPENPHVILFTTRDPCATMACFRILSRVQNNPAVQYFDTAKLNDIVSAPTEEGKVRLGSAYMEEERDPEAFLMAALLGRFSNEPNRVTMPLSLFDK